MARASLARVRARWASRLLPAPLGAVAAALAPADLVAGVLGRASLGVLAALIAFAALRRLAAWQTFGGPRSDRLRDLFEAELLERLALAPASGPAVEPELARRLAARRAVTWAGPPRPAGLAVQIVPLLSPGRPAASAVPPPEPLPSRRLARPLFAAAAAALGIVGVMALLAHLAAPRPPPPAARSSSPASAPPRAASARTSARHPSPSAACVRAPTRRSGRTASPRSASSPSTATKRLSRAPRPCPRQVRAPPAYAFDLAVVNDGARPIHDVRLTLTFARRNQAGRRVGAVDRGLFWGGVLAPGAAVKWKVAAPGTEVRLDASVTGTLAAAYLDPAPPDAFAHLLASRFRAVRAHGALMLAYLRDPRADAAVRALEAQGAASKEDAALLARIRRAAAPVFACEVRRAGPRVEACVFNASSRPRSGFVLEAVGPDGATARSFPLEVAVPVHEGRRVGVEVPADAGGRDCGGGSALSAAGPRGVSSGTSWWCWCR